ncbi:MAG: ABC transporter permease [Streptosporangiaceae bacterium]
MTASTQTGGQRIRATEVMPAASGAGVIATVLTVAMRGVRRYMRTPQMLVFNLIGLATFGFLFRYIFGGAIHLGSVPYVDFLVPGFVLTSVLITGTGVSAGVAEHIEQGSFDRLRSLPVPRLALAAGQVAGDTVVVALGVAVTVAMGFAAGFRLHGSVAQALAACALSVLCGFAFLWMFVTIGLVAGNAQSAQGLSMAVYPFIFISSAYVRVGTMPGWLQPVAAYQPVTIMSNAVRSLALGNPAAAGLGHTTTYWVALSLVWAAGLAALFAPLAMIRYRRSS